MSSVQWQIEQKPKGNRDWFSKMGDTNSKFTKWTQAKPPPAETFTDEDKTKFISNKWAELDKTMPGGGINGGRIYGPKFEQEWNDRKRRAQASSTPTPSPMQRKVGALTSQIFPDKQKLSTRFL